jgi:succinate dehydrogenase / fumarate reductase membrane anchor subunit
MNSAVSSRPREQVWLWLAKVLTGVLVFALLAVHLVVNHLVAVDGLLSYNDVIAYFAHPAIPIMEGVFLVLVVTHALLGVRGIALDLEPSATAMRWLDRVLAMLGAAAVIYGVWLLQLLAGQAASG